jgi:hypothetical protein
MEIFAIVLSSLLALISPVGTISDRLVETTLRKQLAKAEQLEVRIDSTPNYQLVSGKVDRVRIAGRGLFPVTDLRIAALEVDTDPIHLDRRRLQRGRVRLLEPLGAGIRLVIREADLQRALQSPAAIEQLRKTSARFLGRRDAGRVQKLEVIHPQIEFLDHQRLRLQVQLREAGDPKTLAIFAESGIEVVNGLQVKLIDPIVRLDGAAISPELLKGLTEGVFERSDLRQFEASGITARVLRFKLDVDQLETAIFLQVAPKKGQ